MAEERASERLCTVFCTWPGERKTESECKLPGRWLQDAVSLRTDFDFFELAADRTTEYHKNVEIPPSLLEDLQILDFVGFACFGSLRPRSLGISRQ